MACPDENILVAFASGSLPMVDAARVEEHLDGCGICFSLVAELARTAPDEAEPTRTIDVHESSDEHETALHEIRRDESGSSRTIPALRSTDELRAGESGRAPVVLPPPRAGKRRPTPIDRPRSPGHTDASSSMPTLPHLGAPELAASGGTVIAPIPQQPTTDTVIAAAPTSITDALAELPTRPELIDRTPATSSQPPMQLGRYTILHRVGAGGTGVIYAAHDRELGRRVALEILDAGGRDPEQLGARLQRHARALSQLGHPNLVAVYDAGCIDGHPFVSMELIEGRSLEVWLGEAAWPWSQKLATFVQAAQGLAAAHVAGIAHGELAPTNVFVDANGNARVGDVGIARALGEGRTDDVRADQLAFSIALFEALYGQRPFDGHDPAAAPPPVIPPGTDVPPWLGAIVLRGLAREPERRFPSMQAMIDAIEGGARRRPSLKLGLAIGAGVLVVAVAGVAIVSLLRRDRCEHSGEQLVGVWDAARSETIAAAVKHSDAPYGATTWPGARERVDRYAASWTEAHRRACEAHAKGTDDAHQLALRNACLERRLQELRGLAELWSEADAQVVEHLHDGVAELVPVGVCDDVAVLAAAAPLPEDPSQRDRIHAARETIARARAFETAALYERGLPLASEAVSAADALRDRLLQAEARLVLGSIHVGAGRVEDGARELDAAMQAAAAAGEPRLLARAAAEYAWVAAMWLGKPDAALQLATLGRATLERVPAERDLVAELWSREGVALRQAGRYPAAVAAFEQALELRREQHPEDDPGVANAITHLANARTALGQLETALAEHRRALEIRETTLGTDHPDVAMSLDNLASVLASMGRLDEALVHARRSLALRERVLGPQHPRVADSLASVGVILTELGQIDEALASHRRALSIREAAPLGPSGPKTALGSEHALVASSLNHVGFALVQLGRWDEADATLQRAVTVGTEAHGSEHPDVATSHFNLGRAAHGRGDYDRAATELHRALTIRSRVLGDRHPTVGTTWLWIARTRRDQRKRAAAREAADAALAIIDPQRDPDAWAQARLVVADVLWEEGERTKARNSVGEALATVRSAPAAQSAIAMLGAWQKARHDDAPAVVDTGG